MSCQDKPYVYPKFYILLLSFGIIVSLGMIILVIFVLLTQDLTGETVGGALFAISVCLILLVGCLFERQNANSILVNKQEIIALKPKRKVLIPWSAIKHIYYTASRGPGAPTPIWSLYIFSKTDEFIIIRSYIKGWDEIVNVLKQHWPKGVVEDIPFFRLVGTFLRLYFANVLGIK